MPEQLQMVTSAPSKCIDPRCDNPAKPGELCRVCRKRTYERRRGSACKRGYDRQWRKRTATFLSTHPHCAKCGAEATDVDHIVPKRKGGSNDDGNLQSLCHSCHSRKSWYETHGKHGRILPVTLSLFGRGVTQ